MCLVWECWTGLHEMAMAAFESQYIGHWMCCPAFWDDQLINYLHQRNCYATRCVLRVNRGLPHDPNLKKQLVQSRCPSDTRIPC
ncbi:hypothetical protein Tco_1503910 [Tanacetum coccineum]